MREPVADASE